MDGAALLASGGVKAESSKIRDSRGSVFMLASVVAFINAGVDRFRIEPFIGCLIVRYLVLRIFSRRVSASPRKPQKFCDLECQALIAGGCELPRLPKVVLIRDFPEQHQ
jgi:hypothetical protein